MLDDPGLVTPDQMDAWVRDFNSWDLCDQACGNLFDKTPYAWEKVTQWAAEDAEFTRRAGYALLACLAWHDKNASDEQFIRTFPVITANVTDQRNFVKKAINWAIRNIGKRNLALNNAAVALSEQILKIDDKTARWIARDAIRELTSDKILERLRTKAEKQAKS
jgi:3-methyladenine DNA glycosylase AlkD